MSSATVFSNAFYGAAKDETATGLAIASLTYNYNSEQTVQENHTGTRTGMAIFDENLEVSGSGVIVAKGSGMPLEIADGVTLANSTAESRDLLEDHFVATPVSGAGLVITTLTVERSNREFENGSLTAVMSPLIDTSTPTTISA
jgi:hypothetical protein